MATTVILRPITTRRQRLKSVLHQTVLDGRYHQTQLLLNMDNPRHQQLGEESDYVNTVAEKVNSVDLNGRTPLMVALLLDDRRLAEKFVRLMLENGANTYVEDRFGQTPLHYACSFGLHRIADIVMSHETFVPRNVVHADMDGNTPLHILVEANDLPYLNKLLSICRARDFDVDIRNAIGLTPLLMAIRLGYFRAAYDLLNAGADPTIRDSEMKLNALDWILREDMKNHSQIQLAPIAGRRFQLIWKRTVRLKSQYDRPSTPICRHRSRFDNESIMASDRAAAQSYQDADDLQYKDQVVELIDQFLGRCPVSLSSKQRTLLSIASACEAGGNQHAPHAPSSYRTGSGWPKTAKLRSLIQRREQSLPLWQLLDLYTTKSSPSFKPTVKPEMLEFEIIRQGDHYPGRLRNSVGASSRLAENARNVSRLLSVVSALGPAAGGAALVPPAPLTSTLSNSSTNQNNPSPQQTASHGNRLGGLISAKLGLTI